MEIVRGKVLKILFKNEENGYAVLKIKLDFSSKNMKKYEDYLYSNILTVTSVFDTFPFEGEELEFTGEFEINKYGTQLKASSFKRINKESKEAVISYLSSDLFPGIGVVLAKKVFDTLGKDCLEKIRKSPVLLDKVEGLSDIHKDTIIQNLEENKKKEDDIVSFMQMGFTIAMARKIVTTLTNKQIGECKVNPYLLIDKVDGLGFIKVDNVALKMGIRRDDPVRLKACVMFYLKEYTFETGNCYVDKDYLFSQIEKSLEKENNQISKEDFDNIILSLLTDGKIILENNDIYEYYIYEAEGKLASNLASRVINNLTKQVVTKAKLTKALNTVKKINNIEYSELQEIAIRKAFENNILVITGGPGTGKTTIIKGILEVYKILNKKLEDVYLLAPTGRAGKRMTEVTGVQAQTIHKFLGYNGKDFRFGENDQLSANLIIVDEMSMVDILLASRLLNAIPIDTKVIIVGDVDQIPSVAPGDVLLDIIKSKEIETIKLDKIHRQVSDSSIIKLAHQVNEGIIPEDILEKQKDRSFTYMINENDILNSLKTIVRKGIAQNMSLQKDIQILAPMYRGILGIDNINTIIQEEFNPYDPEKGEVKHFNNIFRINDKVIQLVNRNEDNIMNGDIGEVDSFIYNEKQITGMNVKFDSGIVSYDKESYEQLKLAYAISIHKSQGSEFYTTIIPFTKKYNIMLKKRLYYTAITRAKSYLIMLGDVDALNLACKNTNYFRNTKLKEKIIDNIKNKSSI